MLYHYFSFEQIFPFIISALILVAAIITFHFDKKMVALLLLFLGSLGLGYFMANLDHFLILWDEQYHALVAKSMMSHPFEPSLYQFPVLDYDFKNWTANHIWLHKQPLFLWQIALSLKIFGTNALAVRVPSIVMHAFAALMIYRIGKISNSSTVGFYGALFFTVAHYPLELVSGRFGTDHNDIAFLFYVTASFWAWFEYQYSQNKYWIILIGIFAGCAVLVKWVMGLLIYCVWTISIGIQDKKNWIRIKSYVPVLISFLISIAIFLPWQLYIFHKFPQEAQHEFTYNTRHFFEPIENQTGDIWFHFSAINKLYGSAFIIPFILIFGLYFLIKNSKTYRIAILSAIIIVYGFYTIAVTKIASYCIIVSPFLFLALGALFDSTFNYLKTIKRFAKIELVTRLIAVMVFCFLLTNLSLIQNYHTDWKPNDNFNRNAEMNQMKFIDKLSTSLSDNKWVVFNAALRLYGHIPVMFYTDYIAYDFIPTADQIKKVKKQTYKIAIRDDDNLPAYIRDDNDIIKIKL